VLGVVVGDGVVETFVAKLVAVSVVKRLEQCFEGSY
jgi:hypothetical protein